MRPGSALASTRLTLHMNVDEWVRVVFDGPLRVPVLECENCEERLTWSHEHSWWECPSCYCEVTLSEAEDLFVLACQRLELMVLDVREKQGVGRWRGKVRRVWLDLVRLFSRSSKTGVKKRSKSLH